MATSTNELIKLLFARKGRSLEGIAPSANALFQHTNRATYQGDCWSQSLCRIQRLPNPIEWGWNLGEHGYCSEWITIPEASSICKELILCGCSKEKCQKANARKRL